MERTKTIWTTFLRGRFYSNQTYISLFFYWEGEEKSNFAGTRAPVSEFSSSVCFFFPSFWSCVRWLGVGKEHWEPIPCVCEPAMSLRGRQMASGKYPFWLEKGWPGIEMALAWWCWGTPCHPGPLLSNPQGPELGGGSGGGSRGWHGGGFSWVRWDRRHPGGSSRGVLVLLQFGAWRLSTLIAAFWLRGDGSRGCLVWCSSPGVPTGLGEDGKCPKCRRSHPETALPG